MADFKLRLALVGFAAVLLVLLGIARLIYLLADPSLARPLSIGLGLVGLLAYGRWVLDSW